MSYPAIEAKGVRFSYGKNEILHGMLLPKKGS